MMGPQTVVNVARFPQLMINLTGLPVMKTSAKIIYHLNSLSSTLKECVEDIKLLLTLMAPLWFTAIGGKDLMEHLKEVRTYLNNFTEQMVNYLLQMGIDQP